MNPNSPARSLKDLIAFARARPGKLNVGTINVGSTQHLAAELFKSMAGLDMVTVPFNNTGAVRRRSWNAFGFTSALTARGVSTTNQGSH